MKADYTDRLFFLCLGHDGDNRQMKADYTLPRLRIVVAVDGDNRQMKADYTTDVTRHTFYEGH